MGRKNFRELEAKLTAEQREQVRRRTEQLRGEIVLAELRKLSGLTQVELAKLLNIAQPTLCDREKQTDMEISTLAKMIEAMGGRLELTAVMPNGSVRLTQFTRGDSRPGSSSLT